jgi:hypothetical protein
MIRPSLDILPTLTYESSDSGHVLIDAQGPGDGWILLKGGGSVQIAGQIDVDFDDTGDNGRVDGVSQSSGSWYYVYIVESSTNDGEAVGVIDDTAPGDGGPSGYDRWRYVGPFRTLDASATMIPFYLHGDMFGYINFANQPALFAYPSNPALDVWGSYDYLTNKKIPPTAGTAYFGTAIETHVGSPTKIFLVSDTTTPSYTPRKSGLQPDVAIWSDLGAMHNIFWEMPVIDGKIYTHYDFASNLDGSIYIVGFRDHWLMR